MTENLGKLHKLIIIAILLLPLLGLATQGQSNNQGLLDDTGELTIKADAWQYNGIKVPGALCPPMMAPMPPAVDPPMSASLHMCSDGHWGAYILWYNYEDGSSMSVSVRRVNSSGHFQWSNTVKLQTIPYSKFYNSAVEAQICADGTGGAIITWVYWDSTSIEYIRAQRLNSTGHKQWGASGTQVSYSLVGAFTYGPQLICDGNGVIIAWDAYRVGSHDIYVQRLNLMGIAQWTDNGTTVSTASGQQTRTRICTDGAEGVIIAWLDGRTKNYDIYAQRVDASGTPLWTTHGEPICTSAGIHYDHDIVSDGVGGAFISWSVNSDTILAQRIDSTGTVQWTTNGVTVCNAASMQMKPRIVSDGGQGCYITWVDRRSGAYDIYAQRLNSTGGSEWTNNGMVICNAADDQDNPQMVPDNTGGAVITWDDRRTITFKDIYAQHIDSSGNASWGVNGKEICIANLEQSMPQIANVGSGNVLIAWKDGRAGGYAEIYIQRRTVPQPSGIPGFELGFLFLALSLYAAILVFAKKKTRILPN